MSVSISKESFEETVASIAKNLVDYSYILFHYSESFYLLVFGLDKEGEFRHFRTIIDK